MNKKQFIAELKQRLAGIPEEDLNKTIDFYSEMIDDIVDDGKSEKAAVQEIGDIDNIVNNALSEVPIAKIIKEKAKPKRELKTWQIILIVLGSPLWLTLIVTILSIFVSIYATLWAIVATFLAVEVTFAALVIAFMIAGLACVATKNILNGLIFLGAAIAIIGILILWTILTVLVVKLAIKIGKLFILAIKRLFIGKEK